MTIKQSCCHSSQNTIRLHFHDILICIQSNCYRQSSGFCFQQYSHTLRRTRQKMLFSIECTVLCHPAIMPRRSAAQGRRIIWRPGHSLRLVAHRCNRAYNIPLAWRESHWKYLAVVSCAVRKSQLYVCWYTSHDFQTVALCSAHPAEKRIHIWLY